MSTSGFKVVIPARYASSRLPGKPLADIHGKPMVQWVYEKARQSQAQDVIVAVDDERVEAAVKAFGGQVIMTPPELPSGTDRLQYVASHMSWADDEIVVNVQGDEPLLPPQLIDQVASNLAAREAFSISTLYENILREEDVLNPNIVKAVVAADGQALYFSRAPIPWDRDKQALPTLDANNAGHWKRHIGMYGYRVGFLNQYVQWEVAPLESLEALEQLRAIYNGALIHIEEAAVESMRGVDTEADLKWVQEYIASNG